MGTGNLSHGTCIWSLPQQVSLTGFTVLKESNMLSLLQQGWNKIYLALGVQNREAQVVGIIQTQMNACRISDDLRHKNVETFGFGDNISILSSSIEFPFTTDTTGGSYDSSLP